MLILGKRKLYRGHPTYITIPFEFDITVQSLIYARHKYKTLQNVFRGRVNVGRVAQ